MAQDKRLKEIEKDKEIAAELSQYRKAIDELDDSIINLLFHRTKIVEKVGALKSKHPTGKSYIRAGREALLVRRIVQKFSGSQFPPQAAAWIWRVIISASTSIESSFKVSTLVTDNDNSMYWYAREYFGSFTPMTKHPTASRVIGEIADGKTTVGVLPYPNNSDASNWWGLLAKKSDDWPKIFACIPFVSEKGVSSGIPALAIGHVNPEPTGDDRTCLLLEVEDGTSTHRIKTALTRAGLEANWVSIPSMSGHLRQHYLEIEGFITPEHEDYQKFLSEMGEAVVNHYIIGAYALPIAVK